MAVEILTLDSTHDYQEQEFQLDGETFRLLARWNERIDSWIISLYESDGTPVAVGRRLTVGNFLFPWLVTENRPAGQLIAIDTKDEDVDPGHFDLGNRVVVAYLDIEEMAALGANGG